MGWLRGRTIAGDFNRHDQLWGGDEVSMERQGEADPIIDMMNELALSSLLRRGTKTCTRPLETGLIWRSFMAMEPCQIRHSIGDFSPYSVSLHGRFRLARLAFHNKVPDVASSGFLHG